MGRKPGSRSQKPEEKQIPDSLPEGVTEAQILSRKRLPDGRIGIITNDGRKFYLSAPLEDLEA